MKRSLISWLLGAWLTPGARGGSLGDLTARGRAHERALEETWTQQLDLDEKTASQKSPVQRVVALLKEMKAQLESEAESESEMYDKMTCWCTTNEKEKTKAIADAEAKTSELEAAIQGAAAKKGELATEITALKEQIAEDQHALKTATAIREKAAEAFAEDEKEMVQAITNLGNAVRVLAKHHGGSLLQLDSPTLASVRAVLQDVSLKYDLMQGDSAKAGRRAGRKQAAALLSVGGEDNGLDKRLLAALGGGAPQEVLPVNLAEKFLSRSAKKASAFVQSDVAPTAGSYSPQSSTIFGILQSMKDEFESNLSQMQKDELKERADFEELSKAKTEQIAVGKEKLDSMEGEYAANEKLLSDGKEDLELTRQQRASDVEFLSNLRLTCQDLDHQWAERSKTRGEELTAVAEAIAILTEDDNRELLAKTVSLLQVESAADSAMAARRSRAAAFLRRAARSPDADDDLMAAWNNRQGVGAHNPKAQLSTLAVSVELDSFTEVKAVMDKMVVDLKKQQEEEVQAKSNCQKEFSDNEKITYEKTTLKEDLEATIASLEKKLETLADEVKSAKEEIAATKKAVLEAGQTREKENKEFQTVVAEQRATQEVLKKALKRLELFYKKASFIQGSSKTAQTPPAQFTDYKKNAGSVSVMGLLEQIIGDSKKLEAETVAGESKAQVEYETFVKDSNGLISGLEEQVLSKSKLMDASKVELEEASSDHQGTLEELESLAAYLADLHMQCDFLMKNFDLRQKARLEEIEAIQQAKAILSGMSE